MRKYHNLLLFAIIMIDLGCAKKNSPTTSQQNDSFNKKDPLIRVDGVVINKERLKSIDENDIDKIEVYKGESAIAKYGKQAKDGAIDIYTKSYKELRKKEFYNKLQDYLKSASGSEDDFLFVLNGVLIDETNIDQLLELDYAEIEIVQLITEQSAKTIYGDQAKPNTILVTTTKN